MATNDPRHNNVSRNEIDPKVPHSSTAAREAVGDYDTSTTRTAKSGGGMTKWLAIGAAVVLGVLVLGWLFTGDADETAVAPATIEGEEAEIVAVEPTETDTPTVAVTEDATAPLVVEGVEETSAPAVALEEDVAPAIDGEELDAQAPLIETDAEFETVPVTPID
jgi:hypothetical protein